jgi:hypothetical protein
MRGGAGHAVECSPRYEHGGEAGASPGVRRTARRRVWRAACEEWKARGPLELLGARGLCALRGTVSAAAHRRVRSPGWPWLRAAHRNEDAFFAHRD